MNIGHSYRKDTRLPVGTGYSLRPAPPSSIVIHTTNNKNPNTSFQKEAEFLRDSHDVGANFLVGKQGQIEQILHPDLAPWHAGGRQKDGTWTAQQAFDNSHSIGIECHVSVGEAWTAAQRTALTELVRWLMGLYGIAAAQVETHRKIALPPGRKTDPEGWPNAAFYAWQAALQTKPPPVPTPARYCVVRGLPVYQRSDHTGPLWGYLLPGENVVIDDMASGHLADGRGFVDLNGLQVQA